MDFSLASACLAKIFCQPRPSSTRMTLRKVLPAVALLLRFVLPAVAGEVADIPAVGAHHPILIVEKNVHPQNLLVVYTKLDAKGHFLADPSNRNQPVFDYYWLMDGKNYKAVNSMIRSELRKRFESQASTSDQASHFVVNINDLKEVDCDIKDPKMDVYASGSGGDREVEAQMNLGPSDGNMRIKLSSIYSEGRAFPPAVYAITLKGEELVNGKRTGKKITRKYEAKK